MGMRGGGHDGSGQGSGGEEALAAARERLVEIRTQCGATGLDVVAENVARFTPPSAVPPDAIRRPARS
jgi:hypothetical protein